MIPSPAPCFLVKSSLLLMGGSRGMGTWRAVFPDSTAVSGVRGAGSSQNYLRTSIPKTGWWNLAELEYEKFPSVQTRRISG